MNTTPVIVLSGFLGSGKTTLLNALLRRDAFAHTAVVVNEFGEIGLDHLLLAQASDSVMLLEGGCLCCTVVDSLHETLAALHVRRVKGEIPPFERLIIETTGLADPGPIVSTLLGHRSVTDHYRFEALVVTVDTQHALTTIESYPEAAKQIALADRLILTKRDVADVSEQLVGRLRALNPTAEHVDGRNADAVAHAFGPGARYRLVVPATVQAGSLLGLRRIAHTAGLQSHAFLLAVPPSWAGVAAWWRLASERFGDRLLRSKGIVAIANTGEVVLLQTVQRVFHAPERLPGWPDADERSRLVCITNGVDREALASTLPALEAAEWIAPP